jgi:hypothetical protein
MLRRRSTRSAPARVLSPDGKVSVWASSAAS